MKAKPIFTIGLPCATSTDDFGHLSKTISLNYDDYHILMYIGKDEDITFKVFYEKDFNKVKYEELKKIIKESINGHIS